MTDNDYHTAITDSCCCISCRMEVVVLSVHLESPNKQKALRGSMGCKQRRWVCLDVSSRHLEAGPCKHVWATDMMCWLIGRSHHPMLYHAKRCHS